MSRTLIVARKCTSQYGPLGAGEPRHFAQLRQPELPQQKGVDIRLLADRLTDRAADTVARLLVDS
jgi:hypothetical protein